MRLIDPRSGSPVRGSVMYFFQFICFDFISPMCLCQCCMKKHRFTVVVKTDMGRKDAAGALTAALGWSVPGICEFHLRKSAPKKKGGAK